MPSSAAAPGHLRIQSSITDDSDTRNAAHSEDRILEQLQGRSSSNDKSHNDTKAKDDIRQPSGDPWFQKHGVKGFLSSRLLVEDLPAGCWILDTPFPKLPPLSPRNRAQSTAKVGIRSGDMEISGRHSQIRNLHANPPNNAIKSATLTERRENRMSTFEPSRPQYSRFDSLAHSTEPLVQVWAQFTIECFERYVRLQRSATKQRNATDYPCRSRLQIGEQAKGACLNLSKDDNSSPTDGSKNSNKAMSVDQTERKLDPKFSIRKEKKPLVIRKQNDEATTSSPGPTRTTQPVAATRNPKVESPAPTSHSTPKPKPSQHHRQPSSRTATAPSFLRPDTLKLATTTEASAKHSPAAPAAATPQPAHATRPLTAIRVPQAQQPDQLQPQPHDPTGPFRHLPASASPASLPPRPDVTVPVGRGAGWGLGSRRGKGRGFPANAGVGRGMGRGRGQVPAWGQGRGATASSGRGNRAR